MKPVHKSYVYALLSVLCWSTIASAFKLTLRYTTFTGLVFFSVATASVFLTIFMLISYRKKIFSEIKPVYLYKSAISGFLNPFLYYLVLIKAYSLIPAQEAGTLNYSWPVVLVILSAIFLKQKIRLMSIAAIFLSFCGIIIISTEGRVAGLHFSNITGVSLAVGSSLIWATYWLINIKDKRSELSRIWLNFIAGFIYIVIYTCLFAPVSLPGPEGLIGTLYIGLFEMGITFILWMKALKYASSTAMVSNLIYLSPVISLFIISFAVGEKILLSTVAGLLLIIGGILLQQFLAWKQGQG